MKPLVWIVALSAGAILVIGVSFLVIRPPEVVAPTEEEWDTYRNEAFAFEIDVPQDWVVVDRSDVDEIPYPAFHFLPPEVDRADFGEITHHTTLENVSIFPHGVPTEGVFGESERSHVVFRHTPAQSFDFLLENGDVWAVFATFVEHPDSWNQSGFIWSHAAVADLEVRCLRGGEEMTREECDPMEGDEIIRSGFVSEEDAERATRMLESFRFLEGV